MTITFPRPLYRTDLVDCAITLDPGTARTTHGRGFQATVSRVREPLWMGKFSTPRIARGARIGWQAWSHSLDGGLKLFTAWDVSRHHHMMERPYPSEWDGTANLTDLSQPGQITLSGVPSGYQAKAGDRIGLEQAIAGKDHYGYFEIIADATASGGGAMTVLIQPFVQPVFTPAATARFLKPLSLFRLGEFKCPMRFDFDSVTFDAVQVLWQP